MDEDREFALMRRPTKAESARENAQINARIAEETKARAFLADYIAEHDVTHAALDLFDRDLSELFGAHGEKWIEDRVHEQKPGIREELKVEITEELRASLRTEVLVEVRTELAEKIDDAEWTAEQNTRLVAENKALRAKLRTFEALPSTPRRKRAELHELRQRVAELTAEIAKLHGAETP